MPFITYIYQERRLLASSFMAGSEVAFLLRNTQFLRKVGSKHGYVKKLRRDGQTPAETRFEQLKGACKII